MTANAQNLHFTRHTFVWFKYRFWMKKTSSRAAAHAPGRVGELAELEEVVRLHQREPVLEVEALVRLHLLADRVERRLLR